ncbi:hypothetical protein CMO83_04470 [Candidatus Woesearchaeota archaeon]|jgi:hypothetical protein|nr:hypothetical protein [Candidatus Woesearchaeota archaeon]MDP6648436.1 alpha/beta hydrolase [Candidatus Woesearchaeota archaeon]|tara:strand:- start:23681 stop:24661 length:981 start_codon:yes stop_codon:yes gene_type:complete
MKIKKNLIYGAVLIVILVAGAFYYISIQGTEENVEQGPEEREEITWLVDKGGYLFYPSNRGMIEFNRENISETDTLLISKIIFPSKQGNVYGLLVLPKSVTNQVPGVVLLPGAGVSKESELELAKTISELGAAVFTIDQRGVGETNGIFPSLDEDYADFLQAKEPVQHLMIYDALRAYDLLFSAPFVDPDRIIIAGESLGGRVAIIAAAIDRRVDGVLAISSAGFDFEDKGDQNRDVFLKSIDSDHYIDLVSPRKLVMIHSINDNIIPITSAIKSFSKAQQPKRFILINDTSCNHGYCDSMYDGIVESLEFLVDIKSRTVAVIPDK